MMTAERDLPAIAKFLVLVDIYTLHSVDSDEDRYVDCEPWDSRITNKIPRQ